MPEKLFNPENENIRNPEFFANQIKVISEQLEKLYGDIKKVRSDGNIRDGSFLRILFDALFKGGGELKLSAENKEAAEEAIASHVALAEKFTNLGIVSIFSIEENNGQFFVVVKVNIKEKA
ncbi:hypothetical protein EXS45_02215 [Candidatus Nomurabacteria bacterium]|nr:hypothetical protein [Candidatus Nomurabacteria bacterium]